MGRFSEKQTVRIVKQITDCTDTYRPFLLYRLIIYIDYKVSITVSVLLNKKAIENLFKKYYSARDISYYYID